MANRLAKETSTYLLQHADNPVDWYPWGEEALAKARLEDKPILLSIGYSACHWCHVMAHESFEDPETASIMNENYVNIKVDREERPDLDSIYMDAVVAMTGQGGWPMTVVLTPDGEPFFGGTYYPPLPRYGMPSFKQVLVGAVEAWQDRRKDVMEQAATLADHIGGAIDMADQAEDHLNERLLQQAQLAIEQRFEPRKGGFGRAPKFPQAMIIEFLLRRYLTTGNERALEMAEDTLIQMAYGGIYDQLGGGFARYSTDDDWLVPHFEKMLYDNALLSRVYLHAWQITDRPLYRRIAEETLDWALVEMRHEDGGFYSSLDADSEGEEGKFYVWQAAEVRELLGEDAGPLMLYYDVTEQGNWEGNNILNVTRQIDEVADIIGKDVSDVSTTLNESRLKMYAERAQRVWPGRDEKVLTSWNGLMLASLAEAGRDLKRPDYTQAAIDVAEHIYLHMRKSDGRLLRTWRAGADARYNAYLEDYAFLADGLLALYQNTFDERWFVWARELVNIMVIHFSDGQGGGFFDTSDDHEALIHRPKSLQDNAIPSGNAAAIHALMKLSLYTGDGQYWDIANEAAMTLNEAMGRYPIGFAHWLNAADFMLGKPVEVAISGDIVESDTRALLEVAFADFRPYQVVAAGLASDVIPLLQDRRRLDGMATAYVCRRFACQAPVTGPGELEAQLK